MKSGQRKAKPRKSSASALRVVSVVLLCVVAAVAIWKFAIQGRSALPPEVSLQSIDRNLASLIQTSRVAVVASRKSAPAWGRLGQCFHAAEFHAEAIVCYSNAARLDPLDVRWQYLLGRLELQDCTESGIQHLIRATQLSAGENEAPRFALARALVERGRFDEARPHLGLVLAVNPSHAAAHLEMARIHAAQNRLKEATESLQSPMANPITRRAALLLAAQVAQRNDQPDMAAQLSRSAMALPPGGGWPDPFLKEVQSLRTDRANLADAANALIQQQRLTEAEAALTKLFNAFPDDAEGLLLLGRLRYVQKNCSEAEAAYRRYLQVQPGALNGLVQLGIALMCQERWTNAAAVLEQAVSLKTDFGAAHHNLGVCRSRMGNSAGAIHAFRDALRSTPGDVNTLFALAEELANANQLAEAIDCVKRAEALAPADPRLAAARKQLALDKK